MLTPLTGSIVCEIPNPICKPTISPPICIPARINLKNKERRKKIKKSEKSSNNNVNGDSGKGKFSFITEANDKDNNRLRRILTFEGK